MNTKEDRRVRKTKKALREGLAELLMEKSIQHITVRELTDKADVHRSTFYANFNDIYDLYKQMEDVAIEEISDILSEICTSDAKTFLGVLLRYISDNKQVCRLTLGQNVNSTFFHRISTLLKDVCITCWQREHNLQSTADELAYYAEFFLSGSLGVIGEWVTNNFEQSIEELTLLLADIDYSFGQFIKEKFMPSHPPHTSKY